MREAENNDTDARRKKNELEQPEEKIKKRGRK